MRPQVAEADSPRACRSGRCARRAGSFFAARAWPVPGFLIACASSRITNRHSASVSHGWRDSIAYVVTTRSASASCTPGVLPNRREYVPRSPRRMQEHQPQLRCEARRFGLPVSHQRCGHDEQRGSGGRIGPSRAQEQRQHLEGLSQTHVIGETGAEPHAGQEVEPCDPPALVGAQLPPEAAVVGRARRGLAHLLEKPSEVGSGLDVRPRADRVRLVFVAERAGRSGQQAHTLQE